MIHILIPSVSNRLEYTIDYVFKDLLNLKYRVYLNREDFNNQIGNKIDYGSNTDIEDSLSLPSSDFIFETGIQRIEINIHNGKLPFLFYEPSKEIEFDLFSAVFYLVSRYEEYLPFEGDKFGRFEPAESILHEINSLQLPLVNLYAIYLRDRIEKKFSVKFHESPSYRYLPTYDVDMAFAYKGRDFKRTVGGIGRSLSKLAFRSISDRLRVLKGKQTDPYFTFPYLDSINDRNRIEPKYFFHVGDYGKFDKSITVDNQEFTNLIKETSQKYEIGLHPSFDSNKQTEKLSIEKERLESIIDKKITISRQHFLKFTMPDTHRRLEAIGIKEDYSMGYAGMPGFRAGTCTPFLFFDLEKNKVSKLKIIPLAVMDTTFNAYLKVSPEEAEKRIKQIIDQVKEVRGTFVTLWHNNSINDYAEWKGWGKLYERVVDYANN